MSYTPNNNGIYDAAFSGYCAGIVEAGGSFEVLDDEATNQLAQLFAQAVDQLIGTAGSGIDSSVTQALFGLCYATNALRAPITSANVSVIAEYIVELLEDLIGDLFPIGSGLVAATVERFAYDSGTPQQMTITSPGVEQIVLINTDAGVPVLKMPTASLIDGQRLSYIDANANFGNNAPEFTVTGGAKIADPNNGGAIGTTPVSAVSQNGNPGSFVYGKTENTWFLG
jgi:hypothetical protein